MRVLNMRVICLIILEVEHRKGGYVQRLSRLKEIRERASMTQGELAKRSGLGRASIAALEIDRGRRAQPRTARKIADALGVDVEELHKDKGSGGALRLTAVYERDGAWWMASCPEIPGAVSQGRTLDEARFMLRDATRLLAETRRDQDLRRTEGRPDVIREPLELREETTKADGDG